MDEEEYRKMVVEKDWWQFSVSSEFYLYIKPEREILERFKKYLEIVEMTYDQYLPVEKDNNSEGWYGILYVHVYSDILVGDAPFRCSLSDMGTAIKIEGKETRIWKMVGGTRI